MKKGGNNKSSSGSDGGASREVMKSSSLDSKSGSSSNSNDNNSKSSSKSSKKEKFVATKEKTSSEIESEEIEALRARLQENIPESGGGLIKSAEKVPFTSMPLSKRTLMGLALGKLEFATDIQAAALPYALAGRDILGAAKTGSGKTLSFVIPLLEKLYLDRWGSEDGLGALILAPTRELALQIFEVLRIVGRKHQFSAGLITGGKSEFDGEQARIVTMNILVATPGRLLQHLEQTPGFDATTLQVLVLDEADRILDMGFNKQVDAIISYLPTYRQTMLFSATQTKSVKDLARLSLNNPEYIAVHADDDVATPSKLVQNYIVCKLTEKLDILFSFLKTHLKSKMIVFFSTCNQVRYVYELFRGMQPGIVLTALHGKIKQERRSIIYMDFVKRNSVCMFATDIAARGLDFPDVDWVIQVDAPEDRAMYIHRVGRTARYVAGGRSLLLMLPDEENQVISELKQGGVPISKLTVNPQCKVSVAARASALLAAEPEWKVLAKKAFLGYLRSLQMLPNRQIDVSKLPLDLYATSLGLPFTPSVPIIREEKEREVIRDQKNVNRSLDKLKKQIKETKLAKKKESLRKKLLAEGNDPEDVNEIVEEMFSEKDKEGENKRDEKEKIKSSTNKPFDSDSDQDGGESESDEEDFFQVKEKGLHLNSSKSSNMQSDDDNDNDNEGDDSNAMNVAKVSRKQLEKMKQKKEKIKIFSDGEVSNKGLKVTFDDDGNAFESLKLLNDKEENTYSSQGSILADYSKRTDIVKARLEKTASADTIREKDRVKSLHREQRLKRKAPLSSQSEGPTLGGSYSDDEEEEVIDRDDDDDDDDYDGSNYSKMNRGFSEDDEEDEDEEMSSSKKKKRKKGSKKEKKNKKSKTRGDRTEEEGFDEDDNDVSVDDLRKQEELVLKLLGK